MKGTRTLGAILAISSLLQPSLAGSQKRTQLKRRRSAGPLVDSRKPAAFISFLRTGKVEPLETGVGENYLWFRITNNTRWSIWVAMSGVPTEYGDAELYYTIEDQQSNEIRIDSRCHVCSVNPLHPGRSITFSLPRDHATANSRLRIEYSFQWERDADWIGGSNSTHSVEFHFSHLPKTVLSSLARPGKEDDDKRT